MPHFATEPQLHATAVAIDGPGGPWGVLLYGPSGVGKSDLALRLIDRGAKLIADDRVDLRRAGDQVILSAPAAIAGLLEIRGLGIVKFPHVRVPLALIVELVGADAVERLPDADAELVHGCKIPLVRLNPFELSAPIKVELAARHATAAVT